MRLFQQWVGGAQRLNRALKQFNKVQQELRLAEEQIASEQTAISNRIAALAAEEAILNFSRERARRVRARMEAFVA